MFTTKIDIQPAPAKLNYSSRILTLGSCFSENIGCKLKNVSFDIDINPFGVLFNPISILQSLKSIARKKVFTQNDLFQKASLWSSFAHSTAFCDSNLNRCLDKINRRLQKAADDFEKLDFLFITFGTAWVYKLTDNGEIVANCHKLPAANFERYRLNVTDIVSAYNSLIGELKNQNPELKIIFTVSPVRHWKDGPMENNISKGILLQSVQELMQSNNDVHYFPAFEIVVDELRDYRYYADDMLHPSETALNYIFSAFRTTFFDNNTQLIFDEISSYCQAINHRPIHIDTADHEQFKSNLENRRLQLTNKYPFIAKRSPFS